MVLASALTGRPAARLLRSCLWCVLKCSHLCTTAQKPAACQVLGHCDGFGVHVGLVTRVSSHHQSPKLRRLTFSLVASSCSGVHGSHANISHCYRTRCFMVVAATATGRPLHPWVRRHVAAGGVAQGVMVQGMRSNISFEADGYAAAQFQR